MSSKPNIDPSPRAQAPSTQPEENSVGRTPREEGIGRRAYEIYLGRSQQPGGELDDWLQAERELECLAIAPAC